MAVEPFIDLSTIDLDAIAVSAEEVGRMNPQAGYMRQLDDICFVNDEKTIAVGRKVVQDDEFWVDGHIPGRPIYPGVLMIEAAAQLSSILYHLKVEGEHFMGFTRVGNCSFRGIVEPGDTLTLISIERKFQRRRFVCDVQGYVDDTFVFDVQVTGMMM
jgi:3-hydroxyacyl-[acyl-carrier-protein] dehydratase